MPHQIAKTKCPHCRATVVAYRDSKGRILVTTTLGLILAGIGFFIGGSIGIATGGWGIPATVPLAVFGLVVGAGAGYIISDKLIDKAKCPKCKNSINLGI
jgi:endogenous inhibitor of DNA gyrase (YacG/DUF329 family)